MALKGAASWRAKADNTLYFGTNPRPAFGNSSTNIGEVLILHQDYVLITDRPTSVSPVHLGLNKLFNLMIYKTYTFPFNKFSMLLETSM
jgi:hypothetical protein